MTKVPVFCGRDRYPSYTTNIAENFRTKSGYLSSLDAYQTDSSHCIYVLQAEPGQRWNFTLLDFGIGTPKLLESGGNSLKQGKLQHTVDSDEQHICRKYATISEESRLSENVICGGRKRMRSVYFSAGHKVFISVHQHFNDNSDGNDADNGIPHFLLQFEGV